MDGNAPVPVCYVFRTDTQQLIGRPLMCGVYEARLHLELWLACNPDVLPAYTVIVERIIDVDGQTSDTVHFTDMMLRDNADAAEFSGQADRFAQALAQDLITAEDFACPR
jgi:hypothetical protein